MDGRDIPSHLLLPRKGLWEQCLKAEHGENRCFCSACHWLVGLQLGVQAPELTGLGRTMPSRSIPLTPPGVLWDLPGQEHFGRWAGKRGGEEAWAGTSWEAECRWQAPCSSSTWEAAGSCWQPPNTSTCSSNGGSISGAARAAAICTVLQLGNLHGSSHCCCCSAYSGSDRAVDPLHQCEGWGLAD